MGNSPITNPIYIDNQSGNNLNIVFVDDRGCKLSGQINNGSSVVIQPDNFYQYSFQIVNSEVWLVKYAANANGYRINPDLSVSILPSAPSNPTDWGRPLCPSQSANTSSSNVVGSVIIVIVIAIILLIIMSCFGC